MKKYILYAEDDPDDVDILATALADIKSSIELVPVSNGYELVNYLQQIEAAAYPALILMDMNMPMLDGRETLELLRKNEQYKQIPVKLLSTATSPLDEKVVENQGSEIITKPVTYAEWTTMAAQLIKCN